VLRLRLYPMNLPSNSGEGSCYLHIVYPVFIIKFKHEK
jgi:hypothetical protein